MTTVATDGKTMAADGQTSLDGGHITCLTRSKVNRLRDGSVLGCAGDTPDILLLTAWLLDGQKNKPPRFRSPLAALQLKTDGQCDYWNEDLVPHPIDLPAAVGSGAELALGAMLAGASPKRAVEIACLRDPMSGGTVRELRCRGR